METTVESVATQRRPVLVAGGLGCLALVVLLGLAVGPGDTRPDRLAQRSLAGRLHEPPSRRLLAVLASESRWPHAAFVLAVAETIGPHGDFIPLAPEYRANIYGTDASPLAAM